MKRLFPRIAKVAILTVLVWSGVKSQGQVFQPGNLVILRLGDGTQVLVNSGNTIYLDGYARSGALLNSVRLPDTGSTSLILSGTAATEGGLTRSLDGRELGLMGYNTNRGSTLSGSLSSQSGAAVPRAVATVDAFGNYTLVQASPLLYSATNPRCSATDGTNNFWTAGGAAGTYYVSPPQAPVTVQNTVANTRYIRTRNGNLYFTTRSGTAGLYTFSAGGLPKTSAGTALVLSTGANSQPTGFDINQCLTLAYVADQRANNAGGGIQKWTNAGSGWNLAYTLSTGATSNAFGVTVDFSGPAPLLYATATEAGLDRLIFFEDTNSAAQATIVASAGLNQTFRGIDFAPDLRPIILAQPQSQIVVSGSDVDFTVTVSSAYPTHYQWQLGGVDLTGATGFSLMLHGVTTADQGTYRVVVTNQFGSVVSADALLTVQSQIISPTITNQPASQVVPLGGTAVFQVGASGSAPLTYQWQLNGTNLTAQTNSTLLLANLTPGSQGDYRVLVSNPAGQIPSQPATLTVLVPAASYLPYTNPGAVYFQNFDSLPNPGSFSANADNPVAIAGITYGLSDPFDFAWPIIPNGVDVTSGIGLGGLGLSNTLSGWYGLAAATPKLGACTGDQSTGGIISFGLTNNATASTNRALGLLATSSTGGTAFGVRFLNETTNTLGQITLRFTGELWRQAAVQKVLACGYWIDLQGTNGFSTNQTVALSNLSVSFPPNASFTNPVPMDGTAPANQIPVGTTNQPISNWPPGAALWLIWQMQDATGKGQGLAIDAFAFSASTSQGPVPVVLTIQQQGSSVLLSWPATAPGSILEANTAPAQANSWLTVTQPIVVTNGFNTVSLPLQGITRFYRVKE